MRRRQTSEASDAVNNHLAGDGDVAMEKSQTEACSDMEAESSCSISIPREVLPIILASTTARDVRRLAAVNRDFFEAAESDWVWKKMLPPDYRSIAENAAGGPIHYQSLKQLYDRLMGHVLLGNGLEGYGIDKHTGGIYRTYSARSLHITWGNEPSYWKWINEDGARFVEVAFLNNVCWLELKGEIKTKLPPGKYTLSWVLRFRTSQSSHMRSWRNVPIRFTLVADDLAQESNIVLPPNRREEHERVHWIDNNDRSDSWFEYCAGEFYVGDGLLIENLGEVHLRFDLKEIENLWWKSGMFVDGAIIRQQMT